MGTDLLLKALSTIPMAYQKAPRVLTALRLANRQMNSRYTMTKGSYRSLLHSADRPSGIHPFRPPRVNETP
ncbi:hypothetical protein BH20PSE1_BH20PSE1_20860 [soil metagenome]